MFATSVGVKISLKEDVSSFAPPHVDMMRLFRMSNQTVKYFISNLIARFWEKNDNSAHWVIGKYFKY